MAIKCPIKKEAFVMTAMLLLTLLISPLSAMDGDYDADEAQISTAQRLQINYNNKKITADGFKKHLTESPCVIEYKASGHAITQIPRDIPITYHLTTIDLSNGSLIGKKT